MDTESMKINPQQKLGFVDKEFPIRLYINVIKVQIYCVVLYVLHNSSNDSYAIPSFLITKLKYQRYLYSIYILISCYVKVR